MLSAIEGLASPLVQLIEVGRPAKAELETERNKAQSTEVFMDHLLVELVNSVYLIPLPHCVKVFSRLIWNTIILQR